VIFSGRAPTNTLIRVEGWRGLCHQHRRQHRELRSDGAAQWKPPQPPVCQRC
jgi:hypothetical protein